MFDQRHHGVYKGINAIHSIILQNTSLGFNL